MSDPWTPFEIASDPRYRAALAPDGTPVVGWVWGRPGDPPQYGGRMRLGGADLDGLDALRVTVFPALRVNGEPRGWTGRVEQADRFLRGRAARAERLALPVPPDRDPDAALAELVAVAASGAVDTTPERVLQRRRVAEALRLLADLPERPAPGEHRAWRARHGFDPRDEPPPAERAWLARQYSPDTGGLLGLPARRQAETVAALRAAWAAEGERGWERELWAWVADDTDPPAP